MIHLGTLTDRIMVFGGPYSNVQATRAIRAEARRLDISPSDIICNGDLVAYCADPEDTVNLIRDWGIHIVMGNCEESIAEQSDDCGCGFESDTLCSLLSREWYEYSLHRVSPDNRRWMRDLPRQLQFQFGNRQFAVVHGSANNISEFVFASSDLQHKDDAIRTLDVDCVIGGHCGIPFGNRITNKNRSIDAINQGDADVARFWLNTGVIGMPANDGTRDGWYMLLEERNDDVLCSWNRLSFDSESAAQSMRRAGLGAAYRDALITGRWPSLDVLPDQEKRLQGQPIELAPIVLA